ITSVPILVIASLYLEKLLVQQLCHLEKFMHQ
ncbi:unnamed protein product, partial [marine sediment metagenome]